VAHVADFAGDDLAAMQGRAEFGHDAEALAILSAVGVDEVAGDERAGQAIAIGQGALAGPGQDRLVADVLVDRCAAFQGGIGDVAEELVQQFMETDRTQPLGQAGRILHVDQQESLLLALGLHVAAGQQVLQRAEAQQGAHLEHQVRQHRHRHSEDHRETKAFVEREGLRRVEYQKRDHQAADDDDHIEENF